MAAHRLATHVVKAVREHPHGCAVGVGGEPSGVLALPSKLVRVQLQRLPRLGVMGEMGCATLTALDQVEQLERRTGMQVELGENRLQHAIGQGEGVGVEMLLPKPGSGMPQTVKEP